MRSWAWSGRDAGGGRRLRLDRLRGDQVARDSTPSADDPWTGGLGRRIVDANGTHLVDQADVDALTSPDPLERSIARMWWEHCASQAA